MITIGLKRLLSIMLTSHFPHCLLAEIYSNSFEFDVLIAEIHEPVESVSVAP